MKNYKIITSILLIGLYFFIMYRFVKNINPKSFEIIATFLSIAIGFCFTALSIIATSKFSKKLFGIESNSNNSKTLLHELLYKFKLALNFSSICILFIIAFFTIPEKTDYSYKLFNELNLSFKETFSSLILLFTVLSIYYYFDLIKKFIQFVLKESSK